MNDTANDPIFQPLRFRTLTVKNRIFRSNISGRFDNFDGSGNPARINWELKFARGGVGAIVSSFVPVHIRGRIVPSYAGGDGGGAGAGCRGGAVPAPRPALSRPAAATAPSSTTRRCPATATGATCSAPNCPPRPSWI